ncbi:armadillo-type protein [Mycena leptocephala]|nr:armadillo-type protein [Mycena leptocephala]
MPLHDLPSVGQVSLFLLTSCRFKFNHEGVQRLRSTPTICSADFISSRRTVALCALVSSDTMQTIGPRSPVHVARSPLARSSLFNGQISVIVQTDYASPTSDTYPQYSWSQDRLSPMVIPRASFSTVSEDDSCEVDSQAPGMGDHRGYMPWHRSSMEYRLHPGSSNHSWSQQPSLRPQTPQSVHSWWSDSNSIGPTMSIHAAAKPLIRLMYHRQATNFIEKNRGTSLSPQTMDIYSRYLGYKYIGATTKAAILRDLESRVSEDDADVMIDSLSVQSDLAEGLVNSPHIEVRRSTCRILARLVLLESRSAFTFGAISCLVSLLSDKDPATVDTAIDSTEASMDVRLVNKLLESPNDQIFEVTCGMLKRTALSQCENLVALLGLTSLLQWSDGAEAAINAGLIEKLLESSTPWMTRSSRRYCKGWSLHPSFHARAAMKAGILEFLDKFVDSPNTWILRSTCLMLGHLVRSDSTLVIVVSDSLCEFFMSRLRDENVEITESAISALARFAGFVVSPDAVEILLALLNLNTCDHLASLLPQEDSEVGAAAVVGTGALGHLDGLISSRNNHVRKCTYQLLGNLAYHPLRGPNTFSSGTMAL